MRFDDSICFCMVSFSCKKKNFLSNVIIHTCFFQTMSCLECISAFLLTLCHYKHILLSEWSLSRPLWWLPEHKLDGNFALLLVLHKCCGIIFLQCRKEADYGEWIVCCSKWASFLNISIDFQLITFNLVKKRALAWDMHQRLKQLLPFFAHIQMHLQHSNWQKRYKQELTASACLNICLLPFYKSNYSTILNLQVRPIMLARLTSSVHGISGDKDGGYFILKVKTVIEPVASCAHVIW